MSCIVHASCLSCHSCAIGPSDNGDGTCYISGELADYLEDKAMTHTRGAPYHHQRYHENLKNLKNLTPADVYTERGQTILLERETIKIKTMKPRRLQHAKSAA